MSKAAQNPETLLAKLVSFDTTSSRSNRACIDFIRDCLDGIGIKSEIIAGPDNKACLWATMGPEDKPGIILAGHSDVVPVEGQEWTSDPFKLTERGDKLYARGSCDMKGFIACVLSAAAGIDRNALKQPLHFAFTHDEETSMQGARNLVDYVSKKGIKPGWAWIGEPTMLRIVDAHKGIAAWKTEITGVPGHSSQPAQGLNAIELGARFIDIVTRVAAAKESKPENPSRFSPPYTTFNIGKIKGGTAENIIAEHCEIVWQARAMPGDDLAPVLAEIDRLTASEIKPRLAAFPGRASIKTCACFDIPPLVPTPNNTGTQALTKLLGHNQTEAVSFATEGGFFQQLATHAVICGPGSIEQAHKADEYVERTQLASCLDLIGRVAAGKA